MAKRSNKRASHEERRSRQLQLGMVIFMGVILTTSLFIIAFQLSPTSQLNAPTYNDIRFRIDQQQQLYIYRYNGIEHRTVTLPQQAEAITVPPQLIEDSRATSRITIVRSSEPDQALALSTFLLSESLTKTGLYGVTQAYSDREPLASCDDASAQNIILLFEASNETIISYEDSCARISYADQSAALLTKDAILYRILGIIG
jgi:hypothetical protein